MFYATHCPNSLLETRYWDELALDPKDLKDLKYE